MGGGSASRGVCVQGDGGLHPGGGGLHPGGGGLHPGGLHLGEVGLHPGGGGLHLGGLGRPYPPELGKRAVRILLQCFLVKQNVYIISDLKKGFWGQC